MNNENEKIRIMELREILKCSSVDLINDQQLGLPQPAIDKVCNGQKVIPLTRNFDTIIINKNFWDLLNNRTSKRKYTTEAITLEELSFLLWSTQGVKQVIGKQTKATMRTVPSAGARHPLETYLLVNHVSGLEQGLYHYLALEHKLEYLGFLDNQVDRVSAAFCGQTFFANAAVGFVWSVIPYRSEWRYGMDAQKYALLDAGHVCQNLYLASEAIGCGTCAIGAYDQAMADELFGFDSSPSYEKGNEFVIYAASVGKIS
jgi:SagB-type dehydrogenase family enzyme